MKSQLRQPGDRVKRPVALRTGRFRCLYRRGPDRRAFFGACHAFLLICMLPDARTGKRDVVGELRCGNGHPLGELTPLIFVRLLPRLGLVMKISMAGGGCATKTVNKHLLYGTHRPGFFIRRHSLRYNGPGVRYVPHADTRVKRIPPPAQYISRTAGYPIITASRKSVGPG